MFPLKFGKKLFAEGFKPLTSSLKDMILNNHTTMPPEIVYAPSDYIF